MIRRKRNIKAFGELNPPKVKPPALLPWLMSKKVGSGPGSSDYSAMCYGSVGSAAAITSARKTVSYDTLPSLSRAFVPLTPIYTDCLQIGPRTSSEMRTRDAMRHAYLYAELRGIMVPVLFYIPAYDAEHGFVLVIVSGRAEGVKRAGFMVSLPNGTTVPVPYINMLGVMDYSAGGASWVWLDLHHSHRRLDWLLRKYEAEYGKPDPYDEVAALVKARRAQIQKDGSK